MSGIAGILRRDGRVVPEKWVHYLERTLMLDGVIPHRFEDSIPVQSGDLHVVLMGSGPPGPGPGGPDPIVVDGFLDGECAFAKWNPDTLELDLGRRGTGQKPLYWLDLDKAGDGIVFCSNPLPLLRIASELDLQNDFLSKGVKEYLQLGFVPEGGALFAPVCSIPVQNSVGDSTQSVSDIPTDISTTTAEDVQVLAQVIGMPFADFSLLSKLWQYRQAKSNGQSIVDGVGMETFETNSLFDFLQRAFPDKFTKKIDVSEYKMSRRVTLNAIADYVGGDLTLTNEDTQIQPITFPLAAWFRSPQSNIGQLIGDTILAQDAFSGLPVEHKDVVSLHDAHMQGESHTEPLFALLTLALWRRQVLS